MGRHTGTATPYLTASLGADLRALRKSRGVTLATLAGEAGRSVGWLSQVERDISVPSFDELRSLARVLDVPISMLFGQAQAVPGEEGRVVRAGARRRIGARTAGLEEELLSPDLTDDFEVIHSTFKAGSKLKEFAERPTQEMGYVLAGRLNIWIGVRAFEVGVGDSFRVRGEPYRWENPWDKDAVVIWVIAPPVY
ncbi:MAG: XRE family transcriptional regulator [Pseudomonadota bacterium]